MAYRSRKENAITKSPAIRGEILAPEAPMRKSLTILLVDDEKNMRRVMGIFIRGMGHRPVTASRGKEALRIFKKGGIDLVISDYKMPGMDGLELFQELKKLDPKVRVILATANAEFLDKQQLSKQGIAAVLEKPFGVEEVANVIAQCHNK